MFGDAGLSSVTGRICVVLFLDVLAFSIVIPILPNLILQMCDGDAGQAAFLQGAASSLDGLLKFFMQPVRFIAAAARQRTHPPPCEYSSWAVCLIRWGANPCWPIPWWARRSRSACT